MSILDDRPDRQWRNSDDGQTFYGYDDENGRTTWVDKNGDVDSITDTPSDWEQTLNDEGY